MIQTPHDHVYIVAGNRVQYEFYMREVLRVSPNDPRYHFASKEEHLVQIPKTGTVLIVWTSSAWNLKNATEFSGYVMLMEHQENVTIRGLEREQSIIPGRVVRDTQPGSGRDNRLGNLSRRRITQARRRD